jgi:hypothetical protein
MRLSKPLILHAYCHRPVLNNDRLLTIVYNNHSSQYIARAVTNKAAQLLTSSIASYLYQPVIHRRPVAEPTQCMHVCVCVCVSTTERLSQHHTPLTSSYHHHLLLPPAPPVDTATAVARLAPIFSGVS